MLAPLPRTSPRSARRHESPRRREAHSRRSRPIGIAPSTGTRTRPPAAAALRRPRCPDTQAGRLQPLLAHLLENLEAGRAHRGRQLGTSSMSNEVRAGHRGSALGREPRDRRIRRARRRESRNLPTPLGDDKALPRLYLDEVSRKVLSQLSNAHLVHVRHSSTLLGLSGCVRRC